jgi:ABC-type sugar transport system permease subunit
MGKPGNFLHKQAGYLFITPALLLLCTIVLLPILFSIGMAFFRFDLLQLNRGNPFYGLQHFRTVLTDPLFWNAFGNTLIWTSSTVMLQLFIGVLLALLLNKPIKGRLIYFIALLIPWATPSAVASLLWRWLLHADYGFVNAVLINLRVIAAPVPWLSTPGWAMFWVIMARSWKEYAFCTIMISAALRTIPPSLYEAADIDGANGVAKFLYITLPWLQPTIAIVTSLLAIGSFNCFNMIWMMTKGGPVRQTEILSTYIYHTGFEKFQLGLASAQSIIMVLFLAVIIVFYLKRMDNGDMK